MNINQWIVQIESAYESASSELLTEHRLILLDKFSETKELIDII